ncbi:MAG: hypothetical protein Q4C71_00650 [Microbacteriaceae bacterium]|nr:hypothetical protein [Microbacteriaceae bacterium]
MKNISKVSIAAISLMLFGASTTGAQAASNSISAEQILSFNQDKPSSPSVCLGVDNDYSVANLTPGGRHVPAKGGNNRVYGQPGGTITISKDRQWYTEGSISASATVEVNAVVASASATIGETVTVGEVHGIGSEYQYFVPLHVPRGWVEVGHNGYDIAWSRGYVTDSCEWHETEGGKATVITNNVSYIHSPD